MGLSNALQIGRSGLLAHQSAIQTTGNNLANIATPGYHRQRVELTPAHSRELSNGLFLGQGVAIDAVTRQVNEAIESRLRGAIADEHASATMEQLLGRIESIQNELSDVDLSSQLGSYFNAWSRLSTNPRDPSLRTLLTQEASALAGAIRDMHAGYADLHTHADAGLGQSVRAADDLLTRIESVNDAIKAREGGGGQAHELRDQRGQLLTELSKYLDISTVEHDSGSIDVFVGSLPIVLDGKSRGVEVRTRSGDGQEVTQVVTSADGSALDISTGELGARVAFAGGPLTEAVEALDSLAAELIYQTNRLHSQGQGVERRNVYTAGHAVADPTAALNDAELTKLAFPPHNGSFTLHTISQATGQIESTRITVDLDGLGADTSLNDLAASLSAVARVSATVSSAGHLEVRGDSADTRLSFSDDTSGVLASLGINSFFEGSDAYDMAVSRDVIADPRLISAALENLPGDNRNALALAGLRDTSLESLNGRSISEHWSRHVGAVAATLAQARDRRTADGVVRENLQTQQAGVSGVNLDEETINLMQHQRAYQASARLITVVDELMQTLMGMV